MPMCAHMLKYYIAKLQRRRKHRILPFFGTNMYRYVQNISSNIKCCFGVPDTKSSVSVLSIGPRLYGGSERRGLRSFTVIESTFETNNTGRIERGIHDGLC